MRRIFYVLLLILGLQFSGIGKPKSFLANKPLLESYLLNSISKFDSTTSPAYIDTLFAIIWQESSGNRSAIDSSGSGGVISYGAGGLTVPAALHMAELYPEIRKQTPRFKIVWKHGKKLYIISDENKEKLVRKLGRDTQYHMNIMVAYFKWCKVQAQGLNQLYGFRESSLALIIYNWGIGKVINCYNVGHKIPVDRFQYVYDIYAKIIKLQESNAQARN